jgi:hypothetical protein
LIDSAEAGPCRLIDAVCKPAGDEINPDVASCNRLWLLDSVRRKFEHGILLQIAAARGLAMATFHRIPRLLECVWRIIGKYFSFLSRAESSRIRSN